MKNKKEKNSLIKTITLAVFFAAVILIYFASLTNRNSGVKHKPNKNEVNELLEYDMVNNYPKTARDAVKLHCRYSKLVYGNKISDKELDTVVHKMRYLYSEELLKYNPEQTALKNMKNDISKMEETGYTYRSYTLPEASQIQYYTQNDKEMATMEVSITMGNSNDVGYYYQQYVLVKENNQWKILGWADSQLGNQVK